MSDQLKDISCTDEKAKKIVERFCSHVHWLVKVRYTFKVLFEDRQPSCRTLMEKTASSFFADLNRILQEYLLLECAKITDPATTYDDANFTVDFLVQNISWPNDKKKGLESLQADAANFRKHIKRARNKLLAHLDMETVLSESPLGGFTEGEDKKFFDALQKLCNIAHDACFGTIYGDMILTEPGDVFNLTKALRQAVAFDVALSESSDKNERWLYSCLEKAKA